MTRGESGASERGQRLLLRVCLLEELDNWIALNFAANKSYCKSPRLQCCQSLSTLLIYVHSSTQKGLYALRRREKGPPASELFDLLYPEPTGLLPS